MEASPENPPFLNWEGFDSTGCELRVDMLPDSVLDRQS